MAELCGHLSLRAAARADGRTVLAAQSFRTPFHLSKPYWDGDAGVLLTQIVNATAGILAGDRLKSEVVVDPGAALLVTTPSATRIFRMRDGVAECRQHFAVASGGWLEVNPEPLVPHGGACYDQRTTIDVAIGGSLLYIERLAPGRVGHGEAWKWDRLCLTLDVRVGGELVLRERLDQSGEQLRALAEFAGAGPGACCASCVLIADNTTVVAPWLEQVAALHSADAWLGVSALRRGGWSVKLVARDGATLREKLGSLRRMLAQHFPRLECVPRKL